MNVYFMYGSKLPKPVYSDSYWISSGEAVLPDQQKVMKPVIAAWICTRNIHFLERSRLLSGHLGQKSGTFPLKLLLVLKSQGLD